MSSRYRKSVHLILNLDAWDSFSELSFRDVLHASKALSVYGEVNGSGNGSEEHIHSFKKESLLPFPEH